MADRRRWPHPRIRLGQANGEPPTISPLDVGVTGVARAGTDVVTGEARGSLGAMIWSEISGSPLKSTHSALSRLCVSGRGRSDQ
jgi:hypothetical protein